MANNQLQRRVPLRLFHLPHVGVNEVLRFVMRIIFGHQFVDFLLHEVLILKSESLFGKLKKNPDLPNRYSL